METTNKKTIRVSEEVHKQFQTMSDYSGIQIGKLVEIALKDFKKSRTYSKLMLLSGKETENN